MESGTGTTQEEKLLDVQRTELQDAFGDGRDYSSAVPSSDSASATIVESPGYGGGIYTEDGSVDMHGNRAIRSVTGGWKSAWFIIVKHLFALVAYSGVSRSLVRYLTVVMHEGNAAAANIVMNFSGTSYITPLIGAMLADSSLGRFRTSVLFSVVFLLGLCLITLSGNLPSLRPAQCPTMDSKCQKADSWQLAVLYLAIYTISLGRGGYPAYSVFGAGQFEEEVEKTERSSFFIYFYQALTVGYMISAIGLVYVQEHLGWGVGYMLAAIASLLSLLTLLCGMPSYRYKKTSGNALAKVAQVGAASLYKWRLPTPSRDELFRSEAEEASNYGSSAYTSDFRFLDKAAMMTEQEKAVGSPQNNWTLCTVRQVQEVKSVLRLVPICATCILFTSVYVQLATLFILQGAKMDRRILPGSSITIPPPSLTIFEGISVIICGLFYDHFLIPFFRKLTHHPKGITPLQRIGTGLCFATASMIVASFVERERLERLTLKLQQKQSRSASMSIFFLVPQYFLIGAGEVFTYVGLTEFFYDQSPEPLRTVGSSVSMFTQALGNYFSAFVVALVYRITREGGGGGEGWIPDDLDDGRVDKFYALLALLSAANFLVFCCAARRFEDRSQVRKDFDAEGLTAAADDASLKRPLLVPS